MKKRQYELWLLGRSLDRTKTWSSETAIFARVPIRRRQPRYRANSPKDEMLPLSSHWTL